METKPLEYSEERVLVADDEEGLGKIFEGLLGQRGFKSHHVMNGSDALAELKKKKAYTFLVTDVEMPGMDGLELTKRVKNDFPDVCVIVMTGYSDEYRYIDVVNAGAVDFINKPFRIEELEAKIRRAMIERNTRQTLEKLSITDSLTGLYNQRHFYSNLDDEITRAKRQKQQIGLILLDLDDFKQYNDKHGHLAGDERLKKFGSIITSQIREVVDSGYRYGGDEFAVILSDAGPDTCQTIGQRIARVFREECDGAGVSIGCADFSDNMTPESLVAEADRRLYEDKERKKDSSIPGRKYG